MHGTDSAYMGTDAAVRSRASSGSFHMKDMDRDQQDQEPIGSVISRGTRAEDVPRFWAYVWGPAPATASEVRAAHAA